MSRLGRLVSVLTLGPAGVLLLAGGPSYAGGSVQDCLDQAVNHGGEPPTCVKTNGTWVATWPDSGPGAGPSAGGLVGVFVFLVVVVALAGIGFTVWRVTTARRLATRAGMDPGLATQMTLLTDDGLDATYLAASLRQQPSVPSAPAAPPRDAATRLAELRGLLDSGAVTQAEYDARRRAIIDAV
jgi:hypothetical protein